MTALVFLAEAGVAGGTLRGQTPGSVRISVGPNTRLIAGEYNEPWLAASSTNRNVLIAGSQVGAGVPVISEGGRIVITNRVATVISRDGGRSWAPVQLPGAGIGGFDVMVAAGPEGRLYVMQGQLDAGSLPRSAVPLDGPAPKSSIKVWAADGEAWSWSAPAVIEAPVQPDHPRLVVDMSRGPHRGRVYLAWNDWYDMFVRDQYEIFLHYSDDGGKTFSERQLVDARPGGKLVATEPVVLSDGTLLVTYYQYFFPLSGRRNERMPFLVRRSTDGGRTFEPTQTAFEIGPHMWRDRAAEFPQAFVLPVAVADTSSSSPGRDHVYVAWDDVRGGVSNIWLVRSTDKGRTWSKPVRVNDNPTTGGLGVKDYRMTPTVAANHLGQVAVSWYDRRNDPTRQCWEYFVAVSTDGGATFSPNRAVSTAPSCPPATVVPSVFVDNLSSPDDPNRPPDSVVARMGSQELFGVLAELDRRKAREEAAQGRTDGRINLSFDPARNVWPGHYAGLAADVDGVFHALWLDRRNGAQELFTARISLAEPARPAQLTEQDVTKEVEIVAGSATFDRAKGVVQFPLQLRNLSKSPIYGPISVRVLSVKQVAGQPTATFTDAALARSPVLSFDGKLGSDNLLGPLDLSEPIMVSVKTQAATGWDASLDIRVMGQVAR